MIPLILENRVAPRFFATRHQQHADELFPRLLWFCTVAVPIILPAKGIKSRCIGEFGSTLLYPRIKTPLNVFLAPSTGLFNPNEPNLRTPIAEAKELLCVIS